MVHICMSFGKAKSLTENLSFTVYFVENDKSKVQVGKADIIWKVNSPFSTSLLVINSKLERTLC